MPKVTAYLDCGCAILEGGGRTWCPSCDGPGMLQARPEGMHFWECTTCGFAFDAIHKDADGEYSCPLCNEARLQKALHRIERKAFNALLQPMKALAEIEAIAHEALGEPHDCIRR